MCTFTVAYYNKVTMIRFLGNIEAKTDAKGRVFIPAGFRRQLQSASEERLVLRKDVFQDCLVLYPDSWAKEKTEQPFVSPEEFSEALQDILGDEDDWEEEEDE